MKIIIVSLLLISVTNTQNVYKPRSDPNLNVEDNYWRYRQRYTYRLLIERRPWLFEYNTGELQSNFVIVELPIEKIHLSKDTAKANMQRG